MHDLRAYGVTDSHGGGVLQLNSSYRTADVGICGSMASPFMRRKFFRRRIRCDGGVRDGPVERTHTRFTTKFSPSATYIRTNLQDRPGSRLPKGARAEASRMLTSLPKPRLSLTNNIPLSSTNESNQLIVNTSFVL